MKNRLLLFLLMAFYFASYSQTNGQYPFTRKNPGAGYTAINVTPDVGKFFQWTGTNPTATITAVGYGIIGNTIAEGNDFRILDGETSFGWGNHNLMGYLLSSTASATYEPLIGFVPYNSSNPNGYISSFTETDPIWSAAEPNYKTKIQNDLLYQPIGSYLTASYTGFDSRYYPLSGNPSNFLISINSSMINTALGYTPLSTTGNGSSLMGIVNTQIAGLGTASTQNTTVFATASQGTKADSALQVEADGSTTNELQSLSIVGQNLTLSSGGGTIVIPNNVYTSGTGIGVSSFVITNTAPDQSVSLTGANGLSISGTYPAFTIAQYIPTINSGVTRPINSTTFTPSTTQQAFLSYNITISCTATIGSASSGSVALQYSTNSGSTWTTVGTVSNSNTVTLAIVLNSVQVNGVQLSGYVPANSLCRMVSTTSGATVINYLSGSETY